MKKLLLLMLLAPALTATFAQQKKNTKSGSIQKQYDVTSKVATVYTTADQSELRLTKTGTLQFKDFGQPLETQLCVFVDPSKTFQSITGIGAALTDASAEIYAKLPKETQHEFMQAYFSPSNGIGYTLARTNIASCDFSSDTYSYIAEGDKELKTFNISHDEKFKIPFIKQATAAAGGKLTLFVSPWSPPAFMKTTNNVLKGGKLKPEFRQSWANHYVKFIKAYEAKGIPVWGLSVQNEPMATQSWESCIFTGEEERDFIKYYLGPTLHKEGLASKKLIAWDHNRDLLYQRASTVLNDPEAAKYVWGIGFHWYETWTGSAQQFDNLKKVHEAFPDKSLIFTEGCVEKFNFDKLNDWALGERYGLSMINDFNDGTAAWTDWNILLDENGGPNHVGNFCFSPVHADLRTGKLIYTNSYYYLGHFSKFVRPGAKRIISSSNRDKLITTAFVNPDGKIAVVVMNKSDDKLTYNLWIKGKAAETTSLPHSISTIIIHNNNNNNRKRIKPPKLASVTPFMRIKSIGCLILLALVVFTSCKKNPPASKPVDVVVPPVVPPVVEVEQPEDTSPAVGYDGYDLAWSDEFNTSPIDMGKWNFETGTGVNGDFGTGQLDRATDRAENSKIESSIKNADGGALAITTRRESFMDRQYTSARLNTSEKGAWGPGYRIEARVWAKDVRYKGQGFAFWMMPAEKPAALPYIMWPQGGEIDVMEYVGAIPNYNLGSVHYAWSWENNEYKDWNHGHKGAYYSFADKQVPNVNPEYGGYPILPTEKNSGSGGFHVYGVDWFTDRMEFRLDSHVYHIHYFKDGFSFDNGVTDGEDKDGIKTVDGKRVMASEYSNHFKEWSPFEHKFYIILTAGVGGKDNQTYGGAIVPEATFPCATYIDWVRVYKRK